MNRALEVLSALPLGTRVVVRYRIDGGTTDALGQLTARGAAGVTVATRTGEVAIAYDDVRLAKPVPPPPPRRERPVPQA
ncbi:MULTISPECIES: hypothetical protein [Arthrobacter]|uniref:putative acetyltransferase n=1 Tax=Arthrobacter TaxID=1663 RepID=UPI001D131B4A|nr:MULTISPECIES: hypothetical protein [Arthrobacter]